MEITYDYYRIFYYVAQYRSFTKAAEALQNNQPNITRCMNNLEQALGCKLFVRTNRGVSLTPEGERLFFRVRIAVEQLRLGEEEIRKDLSLETGTLSIAASETALHLILLKKLSVFHERYPGVHIRITNDTSPQAIAALKNGHADCAVVTSPADTKAPLRATKLLDFQEILLCGRRGAVPAQKKHRLKDLTAHPLICLGPRTSTYAFYQHVYFENRLPFHVDMEAATMDQVLPMIESNLGIGFFAEPLARDAIARGTVCEIPLAEKIPPRSMLLIEDSSRPQSFAMRALHKLLRE